MDDIYTNPRAPGSYGGTDMLRRYSHKPRKQVVIYLSTLDAYTLHKTDLDSLSTSTNGFQGNCRTLSDRPSRLVERVDVQRRIQVAAKLHRRIYETSLVAATENDDRSRCQQCARRHTDGAAV